MRDAMEKGKSERTKQNQNGKETKREIKRERERKDFATEQKKKNERSEL